MGCKQMVNGRKTPVMPMASSFRTPFQFPVSGEDHCAISVAGTTPNE